MVSLGTQVIPEAYLPTHAIEAGLNARHFIDDLLKLKERMRIAVVYSGDRSDPDSVIYSRESTRSWKSYQAVAEDIAASLRRLGFRSVLTMPEDMRLGERLRNEGVHFAWLNTGGVQGRSQMAHAAACLEMIGVPYVGHDPACITILDNKDLFKQLAHAAAFPTAPFCTWSPDDGPFDPEQNPKFLKTFHAYSGPFVVKPVSGRASLHVHVVGNATELADVLVAVYAATENKVLIERYLSGREYSISVAGPIRMQSGRMIEGDGPFAFGALERLFAPGELIFTSMDKRPITAERFRRLDSIADVALVRRIGALGRQVYREFGLQTLIRLDLRSDEEGRLFLLEANPKPDLKKPANGITSLVCEGLAEHGMTYDDLIESLVVGRLYCLLMRPRSRVRHIMELLETTTCGSSGAADRRTNEFKGKLESGAHTGQQGHPKESGNTGVSEMHQRLAAFVGDLNLGS